MLHTRKFWSQGVLEWLCTISLLQPIYIYDFFQMEHPVPYFDVIFQGEKTYGKLRTYKGAQNTMTTFKLTNICPLTEKKNVKCTYA